jgi:hypothetical protein
VREGDGVPKGNVELAKLGALKLSSEKLEVCANLAELFGELGKKNTKAVEQDLFG